MNCLNLEIYSEMIWHEGLSVFSGRTKGYVHYLSLPESEIIVGFLKDDDIQEIKVASSNIGFVRTYRKEFRKK